MVDLVEMAKMGSAIATVEGKPYWESVISNALAFKDQSVGLVTLRASNKLDEATNLSNGQIRVLAAKVGEAILKVVDIQKQGMAKADAANDALYDSTKTLLLTVASIATVIAFGAALWIALGISAGLKKIGLVAEAVAIGDLNQNVEIKTNDEIKDLVTTINVMTGNLRATARIADQISAGDLSHDVKPLSDKDTLGLSMAQMVTNLRLTAKAADTLAAGDLSAAIQPLSDKDVLGNAMSNMVTNLRETARAADQIAMAT